MSQRPREDEREIVVNYFDEKHASLAKMLETMDSVPNRFVTICMGKAMSCGAILLSHGDIRWCGKLSRIMIHNISSGSWGDVTEQRARTDESERMNQVFMELLAKNCGKTYEELQQLIKDSTNSKDIWLDPNAAYKFGIIDKIGTPIIHPVVQFAMDTIPDKERLSDQDKGIKKRTPVKKKSTKKKSTKKKTVRKKK